MHQGMHLLVIHGHTPVLPADIFDAKPDRQTYTSACPFTGPTTSRKLSACEATSKKLSLHLGLSVADLAFALLVLRRVIVLH